MTKQETETLNKLIDSSDYPDLLRELIEKKLSTRMNWYKEHFKKEKDGISHFTN